MKVSYTPIRFPEHTHPLGFLPDTPAAHALWYFYVCAQKRWEEARKSTDEQIIQYDSWSSEVPLWMRAHFDEQRRTIAEMYGVAQDEMQRYWEAVELEAARRGLPEPADVYKKGNLYNAKSK